MTAALLLLAFFVGYCVGWRYRGQQGDTLGARALREMPGLVREVNDLRKRLEGQE